MKNINQLFQNNKKLLYEPEVQDLVDYCRELEGQGEIIDLEIWPDRYEAFIKSKKAWHDFVYFDARIKDADIVVDEGSIDLIKELNNYCWLSQKSKTPIDKYNHAIDALR